MENDESMLFLFLLLFAMMDGTIFEWSDVNDR